MPASNFPKNNRVRSLRAKVAVSRREGDERSYLAAKRELKVELMRDAITELVNSAPLPTREQREELIALLSPKPKRKTNVA